MRKLSIGLSLASLLMVSTAALAQDGAKNGSASPATSSATAITASTSPMDLARAALASQGGDKFKNMTSMVLVGSVELYAPNSTQSIPGKFWMITAGDKMRIDIDARPAVSFKNVYNGQQSYSSMPGVNLPPMSKFGLTVLAKYDQPGYTVTALPDKKKQRAFRIADPEGNATEFYLDPATGKIVTFLIPYNGYTFGTEIKKVKDVEGVIVPYSFTQRLEMPQGAFFAEYSVKEVKLNQPVGDDVFAIPN
ncbi:MAG TPA: hypothetical protein VN643_09770 [Pyrinomonadaceae bacterium]|nr:hypothetical protein [Pyrinomonadaceae bacterium]